MPLMLDDPHHVFVIAELSGNHGQNYKQAERLVVAAAEAGADAVKVQTFTADEICADIPFPYGHDADHDAWARRLRVVGMRDLFARGGFPRPWHIPLKRCAESCGLAFLSTPFSVDAAKFLHEEVGVQGFKIASGDLTFLPLLEYIGNTKLPVIYSTGGATMQEVKHTFNLLDRLSGHPPFPMHCLSVYPCDERIVNLRAIKTITQNTNWYCGFSDHTLSYDVVPALAVVMGATLYEKHIRLEEDTTSVDVGHSLVPWQFARMVEVLRRVPTMLGDGVKEPHALERHDRAWARRSPDDWLRPTQAAREGAWE